MKLPFQLDRYTLVDRIGVGAFGQVFRSEVRGDMGFVSDFAVKVLDSNVVADNPNVARQMGDEARILSALDHPNIVKVIDFKHVEHGVLGDVFFMVMEFVRGYDLATLLDWTRSQKAYCPATAVLHLGLMVADALAHAHKQRGRDGTSLNLVHRDLKPQNLMVNFRGQVKVLDFGIAKATADKRLAARTQEGQTKGTVFYMSPEQLSGDDLDGRSDLYSLGTILFELLLGTRLLDLEINTPADLARAMHISYDMDVEERLVVLKKHLADGHCGPLPHEAVEGWVALLRASLQKDRRYRPDSSSVFSQQLEWLRSRHPPAENRDYWSQQVESCAESQSETVVASGPSTDGEVEDVPSAPSGDLQLGAEEFFGVDSVSVADDEVTAPVATSPPEVPVTRAMSSVAGNVRSFGSGSVRRLGLPPQPDLEDESTEAQRPGLPSGSFASQTLTTPSHPGRRPRRSRDPSNSEVKVVPRRGAAGSTELDHLGRELGEEEAATTGWDEQVAPTDTGPALRRRRRSSREKRRKAGPDRRVLAVVVAAIITGFAMLMLSTLREPEAPTPPPETAPVTAASPVTPEAGAKEPSEAHPPEDRWAAGMDARFGDPPAGSLDPEDAEAAQTEDPGPATTEVDGTQPPPRGTMASTSSPPVVVSKSSPPSHLPPGGTGPGARSSSSKPGPTTPTAEPRGSPGTEAKEAPTASATIGIGTLHLAARPRSRVELNGESVGTSDDTRKGIKLPAGTYKAVLHCDDPAECAAFGIKSAKKRLVVRAGEKTQYLVNFYELNERYDP